MQVSLEEQVSKIIEDKYLLKKCEFVFFESKVPKDPFSIFFTVYTRSAVLLCEWEELRLDDTIGYYRKGQLGLSLTKEEMLHDIRCQLCNCKELNGIHKELLEYDSSKKRNF
ncbi:hypothetical protein LAU_0005 [Lausannevirus]|uniref:Uncharacterized protein n=2 Tax=Lausannevirus TaxID=999883 RepID=A0A0N9P6D2_9VIRU|nr:hypothetical protein LAU_0005 [Lausannevirus]AEA06861.1 hypothetical protein LAU_0005 [Lausannevirus]ALH06703.1 hypothetical protein PMV_005 [Port-miou virus]